MIEKLLDEIKSVPYGRRYKTDDDGARWVMIGEAYRCLDDAKKEAEQELQALREQVKEHSVKADCLLILCIDLINDLSSEKRKHHQDRLNRIWPTPTREQHRDTQENNDDE